MLRKYQYKFSLTVYLIVTTESERPNNTKKTYALGIKQVKSSDFIHSKTQKHRIHTIIVNVLKSANQATSTIINFA